VSGEFLSAFFAGGGAWRVKRRVKCVKVFGVKLFLYASERFTESLEVNNLSCPQEADWVGNLWNVADNTENIVIGGTGFLLWCDLVRTT